jgi:HSP20 family molecular chaperone IbpA
MSRMTLFNGTVWLSQGVQNAASHLGRQDGYPPFNIELLPQREACAELVRITLAVAGFRLEELEVTVGDGRLTVQGHQTEDDDGSPRDYLHRGIAARQFKRSFGLADGVEVCKAELHDGLLTIELQRPRKVEPARKVGIVAGR